MTRKTYSQLATEAAALVTEIMPWDVPDFMAEHPDTLLVDIRERYEFEALRIAGSLNVPRGILESASEWDYPETEPALAAGRDRPVILVCRSGNRSAMAAQVLQQMGFDDVRSMKLGIRGWNDADLPLLDAEAGQLDGDEAAGRLEGEVRPEQRKPA